jgi:hypothetical protein
LKGGSDSERGSDGARESRTGMRERGREGERREGARKGGSEETSEARGVSEGGLLPRSM